MAYIRLRRTAMFVWVTWGGGGGGGGSHETKFVRNAIQYSEPLWINPTLKDLIKRRQMALAQRNLSGVYFLEESRSSWVLDLQRERSITSSKSLT